ncbi:endo-14-beta-xylanase A-like protein, partial [Trifolium medium]|nr:endo-14-beta-xylanase A-like protein [Trifolium medium]
MNSVVSRYNGQVIAWDVMNENIHYHFYEDKLANYIRKLKEIQQFPGTAGMPLAIGLQGHFGRGVPNLAYMRSGLDLLGATGLPIWLTET